MSHHLRLVSTADPALAGNVELDEVLLLADRLERRADENAALQQLLAQELRMASVELKALRMMVLLLLADTRGRDTPVILQFGDASPEVPL
jgi:hypothetical protein